MKQKITPYLKSRLNSEQMHRQYVQTGNEFVVSSFDIDPLQEDEKEAVKGLVHKYRNRGLLKVSYRCAAHCRFCTRYRQIGTSDGDLSNDNIARIGQYLSEHPEINDVILSGGDPMYNPKQTLVVLEMLRHIDSVKVVRIGTRLPIHNPISFDAGLIQEVIDKAAEMNALKPFIFLINIEHPDDLTAETIAVLRMLRARGFTVLSQTVFLKGINNHYQTLFNLFESLYHIGVVPYYIYRCDYVQGVEQFVCDIEDERNIMTQLRSNLSGIACPTYIMDVPGQGKVPVPLNYWEITDINKCIDFMGNAILV